MTAKRRILVVGATGAQGGSVAHHLHNSGLFEVRALTRDPGSDRARELGEAGVEVVYGDLGSKSSLVKAMKDCYGVFGVTNFWEHFDREYEQGRNLANAVLASDINHFVFSTLPHAHKVSGGTHTVPHFDIKGQLEEYSRSLGLPATYVHVAFYYENFLSYFPPQLEGNGSFSFGFPQGDVPLAALSVSDLGGIVLAIFKSPRRFIGTTVGAVGDDQPASAYAEIMSRHMKVPVVFRHIPCDVFSSFGFPGAEELATMFDYNRLYIPERREDLIMSHTLFPDMLSFDDWMSEHSFDFRGMFCEHLEPERELAKQLSC